MRTTWQWFLRQLGQRWMLWSLFFINFFGSIYGFYWYKNQLVDVGSWWNIFVPDSPTASAAFTIVLALFLARRSHPLLEAFAAVTLFKYGVWAIVMIVAGAAQNAVLHGGNTLSYMQWTDWMLMVSHGGMAAQALLYGRFYTYRVRHLVIVGAWTLLNDAVDYVFDLHPWLPSSIAEYDHIVGAYTLTLSVLSITLAAWLVFKPGRKQQSIGERVS